MRKLRSIRSLGLVGMLHRKEPIKRIRNRTDCWIGEKQSGSMSETFLLKNPCDGRYGFYAFVNLEKANDRVNRESLCRMLRVYGVSFFQFCRKQACESIFDSGTTIIHTHCVIKRIKSKFNWHRSISIGVLMPVVSLFSAFRRFCIAIIIITLVS